MKLLGVFALMFAAAMVVTIAPLMVARIIVVALWLFLAVSLFIRWKYRTPTR